MRLIKFTRSDGDLVWINPEHVVYVKEGQPLRDGTPTTAVFFDVEIGCDGIEPDWERLRGAAADVARHLAAGSGPR